VPGLQYKAMAALVSVVPSRLIGRVTASRRPMTRR
jgi:hypothetical protein